MLFSRPVRVVPLLVLLVAVTVRPGPAGAAGDRKTCKLLKPAVIEEVLGTPASKSKSQGTQVAGAKSCAYDVGPGLGEPGGGLVVVTSYRGPVASGVGADIETRAEPLSAGVVWDPLVEVAYVINARQVVGVNVSYTNNQPSTEDLKPEMAELAKVASTKKRVS